MRIVVTLTVDLDPDEWVQEYGGERKDVREDVKRYIQNAVYHMPVEPKEVKVR